MATIQMGWYGIWATESHIIIISEISANNITTLAKSEI